MKSCKNFYWTLFILFGIFLSFFEIYSLTNTPLEIRRRFNVFDVDEINNSAFYSVSMYQGKVIMSGRNRYGPFIQLYSRWSDFLDNYYSNDTLTTYFTSSIYDTYTSMALNNDFTSISVSKIYNFNENLLKTNLTIENLSIQDHTKIIPKNYNHTSFNNVSDNFPKSLSNITYSPFDVYHTRPFLVDEDIFVYNYNDGSFKVQNDSNILFDSSLELQQVNRSYEVTSVVKLDNSNTKSHLIIAYNEKEGDDSYRGFEPTAWNATLRRNASIILFDVSNRAIESSYHMNDTFINKISYNGQSNILYCAGASLFQNDTAPLLLKLRINETKADAYNASISLVKNYTLEYQDPTTQVLYKYGTVTSMSYTIDNDYEFLAVGHYYLKRDSNCANGFLFQSTVNFTQGKFWIKDSDHSADSEGVGRCSFMYDVSHDSNSLGMGGYALVGQSFNNQSFNASSSHAQYPTGGTAFCEVFGSTLPTYMPSLMPSSLPTMKPTFVNQSVTPTTMPTSVPTISEQHNNLIELRSIFHDKQLRKNLTVSPITHDYYQMHRRRKNVVGTCAEWKALWSPSGGVSITASKPFLQAKSIYFAELDLEPNVTIIDKTLCRDISVTNQLVHHLREGTEMATPVFCGSKYWKVETCSIWDRVICIGDESTSCNSICNQDENTIAKNSDWFAPCAIQSSVLVVDELYILSLGFENDYTSPKLLNLSCPEECRKRTSLTVNIVVDAPNGFIFCGAFASPSEIHNRKDLLEHIKSQNAYTEIATGTNPTTASVYFYGNVTISNLIPYTNYSIQCFTKSFDMHHSSIEEIQANGTVNGTTSCCKQITIHNLSPYMSTNQIYKNVYELSLDHPPSENLIVNILPDIATIDPIIVHPREIEIGPQNEEMTRRKYSIRMFSTIEKKFLMTFSVNLFKEYQVVFISNQTSDSYVQFDDSKLQLNLNSEMKRRPQIISSFFSPKLSSIRILFDLPTDMGNKRGKFPCSDLFLFRDQIHNSNSNFIAECEWQDFQSVVLVSSDLSQFVNNSILLRNNTLGGYCIDQPCYNIATNTITNITADVHHVPITLPENVIVPNVMVSAPTVIGLCDTYYVDISNSFGFGRNGWKSINIIDYDGPMEVYQLILNHNWTQNMKFSYQFDNYRDITSISDSTTNTNTIVHENVFSHSGIRLHIQMCNFVGRCGYASHYTVLDAVSSVPSVRILGASSRIVSFDHDFTLSAVAFRKESCDAPSLTTSSRLQYSWSLLRDTIAEFTSFDFSNPSQLLVPQYTLSPDTKYEIRLLVYDKDYPSISSEAKVELFTTKSFVNAVIKGGSQRIIGTRESEKIEIDGSYSHDTSMPLITKAVTELSYEWTCQMLQFDVTSGLTTYPYKNRYCGFDIFNRYNPILKLGYRKLTGQISSHNVISEVYLTVCKDEQCARSTSVFIYGYGHSVDHDKIPYVYMLTPTNDHVDFLPSSSKFVNPNKKLRLQAEVFWKEYFYHIDLISLNWTASSRHPVYQEGIHTVNLTHSYLKSQGYAVGNGKKDKERRFLSTIIISLDNTNVNSLISKPIYSFELKVSTVGGQTYNSSIDISINTPPLPGLLQVLKLNNTQIDGSIIELTSDVVLVTSGWSDDDLPLTYAFGYYDSAQATIPRGEKGFFLLRSRLEPPMTDSITLPVGHLSMDYKVPCHAIAYDSFDAYSSITKDVKVIPAIHTDESYRLNDFLKKELSRRTSLIDVPSSNSHEAFDMDGMFSVVNTFTTALNSFSLKIAQTDCNDAGGTDCLLSNRTECCLRLNRHPCSLVAYTCGECLSPRYIGKDGHSNETCLEVYVNDEIIGHNKMKVVDSHARDKLLQTNRSCPYQGDYADYSSNITYTSNDSCSNRGICKFRSKITGDFVPMCTFSDTDCFPVCICDDNYSGRACHLKVGNMSTLLSTRRLEHATVVVNDDNYKRNRDEFNTRLDMRTEMVDLLHTGAQYQLLDTVSVDMDITSLSSLCSYGDELSTYSKHIMVDILDSLFSNVNDDHSLIDLNAELLQRSLSVINCLIESHLIGDFDLDGTAFWKMYRVVDMIAYAATLDFVYQKDVSEPLLMVTDMIRTCSDIFQVDNTVKKRRKITLPLTSQEALLNMHPFSVELSVAYPPNTQMMEGDDIRLNLAQYSATVLPDRLPTTSSFAISDIIRLHGPYSVCNANEAASESIIVNFRHHRAYTFGEIQHEHNIILTCERGDIGVKSHTCPSIDDLPAKTSTLDCTGDRFRQINITCPSFKRHSACGMIDATSTAAAHGYDDSFAQCQEIATTSDSSLYTSCRCPICRIPQSYTKTLGSIEFYNVMVYTESTFATHSEDGGYFRYIPIYEHVNIVVLLFSCIYAIAYGCLLICESWRLYIYMDHKYRKQDTNTVATEQGVSTTGVEDSGKEVEEMEDSDFVKLSKRYLSSVFIGVFSLESSGKRLLDTLVSNHIVFKIFFGDSLKERIVCCAEVMSIFTFILFTTANFFMVEFPNPLSNHDECLNIRDASTCLDFVSPITGQFICDWIEGEKSVGEYECILSEPEITFQFCIILFACLLPLTIPLRLCSRLVFDVLRTPCYSWLKMQLEEDEQKIAPFPEIHTKERGRNRRTYNRSNSGMNSYEAKLQPIVNYKILELRNQLDLSSLLTVKGITPQQIDHTTSTQISPSVINSHSNNTSSVNSNNSERSGNFLRVGDKAVQFTFNESLKRFNNLNGVLTTYIQEKGPFDDPFYQQWGIATPETRDSDVIWYHRLYMANLVNETYLDTIQINKKRKMYKLSEEAFGLELLRFYVIDILGRNNTFATEIFHNMWKASNIVVSNFTPVEVQIFIAAAIIYMNVMMVLHCLDYADNTSINWGMPWIMVSLLIFGYMLVFEEVYSVIIVLFAIPNAITPAIQAIQFQLIQTIEVIDQLRKESEDQNQLNKPMEDVTTNSEGINKELSTNNATALLLRSLQENSLYGLLIDRIPTSFSASDFIHISRGLLKSRPHIFESILIKWSRNAYPRGLSMLAKKQSMMDSYPVYIHRKDNSNNTGNHTAESSAKSSSDTTNSATTNTNTTATNTTTDAATTNTNTTATNTTTDAATTNTTDAATNNTASNTTTSTTNTATTHKKTPGTDFQGNLFVDKDKLDDGSFLSIPFYDFFEIPEAKEVVPKRVPRLSDNYSYEDYQYYVFACLEGIDKLSRYIAKGIKKYFESYDIMKLKAAVIKLGAFPVPVQQILLFIPFFVPNSIILLICITNSLKFDDRLWLVVSYFTTLFLIITILTLVLIKDLPKDDIRNKDLSSKVIVKNLIQDIRIDIGYKEVVVEKTKFIHSMLDLFTGVKNDDSTNDNINTFMNDNYNNQVSSNTEDDQFFGDRENEGVVEDAGDEDGEGMLVDIGQDIQNVGEEGGEVRDTYDAGNAEVEIEDIGEMPSNANDRTDKSPKRRKSRRASLKKKPSRRRSSIKVKKTSTSNA